MLDVSFSVNGKKEKVGTANLFFWKEKYPHWLYSPL